MTLLLMCARRTGEGERLIRNGDWQLAPHAYVVDSGNGQNVGYCWYGTHR